MAIDELTPTRAEEREDDLDVAPLGADGSLVVPGEWWQEQETGALWKVVGVFRTDPAGRLSSVQCEPVFGGDQQIISAQTWHERFLFRGATLDIARRESGLGPSAS